MSSEERSKVVGPTVGDYGVLIAPILTEKSSSGSEQGRIVTFKVDPRATKDDIRRAVERIFSVKVEAVRTSRYLGKIKRTARSVGRRSGYKKAVVTVAGGGTIQLIEVL
jgi:large subunit ribosomal protein L23